MLRALIELLGQLETMFAALAAHGDWPDGAAKLAAAIAALRAPTVDELALRAAIERDEPARLEAERHRIAHLEEAEDKRWSAELAASSAAAAARERILKAMPRVIRAVRKGQLMVRPKRRA